jgi:predicted Rossmann fold flavoprotein
MKSMSRDPVVIAGAGAAGLLASIAAARQGAPVLLLEKGALPARKILVSGSGRCNISNQAALDHFIGQYNGNGRFLYPAFQQFFRPQLLQLLAEAGVRTKTEPSGKIFPASDKAADIAQALVSLARQAGVQISLSEAALHLESAGGRITGVRTNTRTCKAAALILTTGGLSWPQTGSTGDGFKFAEALGHHIQPLRPALAGINLQDQRARSLQGVTCADTAVELLRNGRPAGQASGDILWTHFGLSGPAVLRVSRFLDKPGRYPA